MLRKHLNRQGKVKVGLSRSLKGHVQGHGKGQCERINKGGRDLHVYPK